LLKNYFKIFSFQSGGKFESRHSTFSCFAALRRQRACNNTPTEQDQAELTECALRDTLFHCVMHTAERIMSPFMDDLLASQPPANPSNLYIWWQGQVLALCGFNPHDKPRVSSTQQQCADEIGHGAGEAIAGGLWNFLREARQ
jgi:hypothetical protein